MRKLIFLALVVLSSSAHAYYDCYSPVGSNSPNSLSSRYYRGEISQDQYVDSQIGRIDRNRPYDGYYRY